MGISHEEIQKKKLLFAIYDITNIINRIDKKYFEPINAETEKVQNIQGICLAYIMQHGK